MLFFILSLSCYFEVVLVAPWKIYVLLMTVGSKIHMNMTIFLHSSRHEAYKDHVHSSTTMWHSQMFYKCSMVLYDKKQHHIHKYNPPYWYNQGQSNRPEKYRNIK